MPESGDAMRSRTDSSYRVPRATGSAAERLYRLCREAALPVLAAKRLYRLSWVLSGVLLRQARCW
jgi:hypothetical protein